MKLVRRAYVETLEQRRLLAADFAAADFNNNQAVNAVDIDLLMAEIRNEGSDLRFDLNDDRTVSKDDVDYLVQQLLGTRYGDVDLDGDVDFGDFLAMTDNFGTSGGWSQGNFDLTSDVAFADFLQLSHSFGYQSTTLAYTYLTADGNRFLAGWGDVPNRTPIDVPLDFVPSWVIGAEHNDNGIRRDIWIAVSDDGDQQGIFLNEDGTTDRFSVMPLPAGVPPMLVYSKQNPNLVSLLQPSQQDSADVLSHPIINTDLRQQVEIDSDANLVIRSIDQAGAVQAETISLNALADSRVLSDGEGRYLVLTDPTDEYRHGIFGDTIEASSFSIVDTNTNPSSVTRIPVPEGRVIESLIPAWIDIDDDGEREIIVTLSDNSNGGQVTVYNEQGEIEKQGAGIGRGFRWRHQLAVAPFGPNGETEFVDVLTPHIGGVVEFRSLESDDLPIVADVPGYTSHVNRTRNIDMAAAADFDGDGKVELLLPNQRRDTLGAITRTEAGAEFDWSVAIGATLTTNVGVLRTSTGQLSVAVGRSDQMLRIWR